METAVTALLWIACIWLGLSVVSVVFVLFKIIRNWPGQ